MLLLKILNASRTNALVGCTTTGHIESEAYTYDINIRIYIKKHTQYELTFSIHTRATCIQTHPQAHARARTGTFLLLECDNSSKGDSIEKKSTPVVKLHSFDAMKHAIAAISSSVPVRCCTKKERRK